MHRKALKELLEQYKTPFPEEIHFRELFFELISHFPDCFERTCMPGHITGSAWIINTSKTKALLVHHKKLDRWLQCGGHADGNPDIEAVAKKEAMEETGLKSLVLVSPQIFDLDIHRIPAFKMVPGHWHYDVRFLFEADEVEKIEGNWEIKEARWVPLHKLKNFCQDRSIERMTQKVKKNPAPKGRNSSTLN